MAFRRENLPTLTACVAGVVLLSRLVSWHQKTKKLPPGPPKLPLIDNLHNMPAGLDWVRFAEMGKEYDSDVIHLSALGKSIIVLNSYEAARELLDKRSGIYSGRSQSLVLNELGEMDVYFIAVPTGDYWRACRRLLKRHVGPSNQKMFSSRERHYIQRFLHQLLKTPGDFKEHIRHLVGANSISMTYGLKPKAQGDPNIQLAETFNGLFSTITAKGAFLVDTFPVLKHLPTWFPGTSFHEAGAQLKYYSGRSRKVLLEQALNAMRAPGYEPSFVSESLQEIEGDTQLSKEEREAARLRVECTAVNIYTAAADTTVSSIGTFFLAMICYPEVQTKLQQELDAMLHRKMPSQEDLIDLPYLTAVVMEVSRWKPVTAIGMPHQVILDDVYKGYYIPKDSLVIGNQWAMLYNEEDYPEPEVFRPERFLKDGKIDESIRNPLDIGFGFGRRICPGKHIAVSLLTLTIASVLSSFDLAKKVDEKGQAIEPTQEYYQGIVCHPKDFPCEIRPRSPQVLEMLEAWALQEDESIH